MTIKPCPKPFIFTNPTTHKKDEGIVQEEEPFELSKDEYKDFYKLAQLLKWKDDGWSIRIGYYLKPLGASDSEWKWGAQNTSIINIESVDKLIKALTKLKETYEKEKQLQK